jgi:preprotein translocase subunit SecE
MKFLKQVHAEMKKVIWPTREITVMYTIIVVVTSVFVAYYLGLFDFLFQNYGLKSLIR